MMSSMQQRVLEHCEDQKTQDKVMVEILANVSMLAQDQYGNYVVQVSSSDITNKLYYLWLLLIVY